MPEAERLQPPAIGDAFPVGSPAGEWVMVLSMAMNDLITLDARIHDALDNDGPEATYFLRLLCGTLRELWKLFEVADKNEQVDHLINELVPEARDAYDDTRELFMRPEATEDDPDPRSWAETHLKDVRDRTFHYPCIGGDELQDALAGAGGEQAELLDSGPRPFRFADLVALLISFGDIDEPSDRQRFEEIIVTAKRIEKKLIPIIWDALAIHLRSVGIDPHRLGAANGPDASTSTSEGSQAERSPE